MINLPIQAEQDGCNVNMPTPTLADVAKVAGVSRMTASRALNDKPGVSDKTREDIQRIASEMGYVANPLAQKLSNGRTHIIGVVAQLHTSFTGEMVMGMRRHHHPRGWLRDACLFSAG